MSEWQVASSHALLDLTHTSTPLLPYSSTHYLPLTRAGRGSRLAQGALLTTYYLLLTTLLTTYSGRGARLAQGALLLQARSPARHAVGTLTLTLTLTQPPTNPHHNPHPHPHPNPNPNPNPHQVRRPSTPRRRHLHRGHRPRAKTVRGELVRRLTRGGPRV